MNVSLQPIHEIERSADDRYQWRATGTDPQFLVSRPFSAGWYELRFRGQVDAGFVFARLYWAVNGVFSEAHATPLAILSDLDEWQTRYVHLREPATSLRLDPMDRPAILPTRRRPQRGRRSGTRRLWRGSCGKRRSTSLKMRSCVTA